MLEHEVLVRGAGAVGLAAALSLSRQGLRVALLGTLAEPVVPDLRAYALNAASVQLLQTLHVWEAIPDGARTAVHDMHIEGDAPGATLHFSAWSAALPELAWIVDAGELEKALRSAVRFAPHVTPVAAEVPATLQVLAEGRDSATRARLGVQWEQQSYGQHALAARLISDQPHAGLARQWFRSPDVLALLPLQQPLFQGRPGHGLALVWSLPDERAAALMALTDDEFNAALNEATAGAAGLLSLASPRAQWPLALGRAGNLHGKGWVLIGDAAHVVHPLAGQGLNLGLGDVAALAQVVADARVREPWRSLTDARLLARYGRARSGALLAMAGVTDGLLQLFASPLPVVKELRNRGLTLANHFPPLKRLLVHRAIGA
ncbi:MAG TPA: FAD-dependent monooxygenase [Rubrivivax sp.]|nr:FAD-dependent monooxygenase [Rubrivivax sp.]